MDALPGAVAARHLARRILSSSLELLANHDYPALAAAHATPLDRDRITAALDAIEAAHAAANPEDEAEADAALHQAIYEASHNLVYIPCSLQSRGKESTPYLSTPICQHDQTVVSIIGIVLNHSLDYFESREIDFIFESKSV